MTGYRTDPNTVYELNSGNNLISFPADEAYAIEDVLPDYLDGVITAVLAEGNAALYMDGMWFGTLTSLEGFNGYWFRSNDDIDFVYDISENALSREVASVEKQVLPGYEYIQSSKQSFYFIKDIPEAEIGDWIIAFNEDVVVGTRRWDGAMVDVPVMGDNNEFYSFGYVDEGQIPDLRLYKTSTGELLQLHGSIPGFIDHEIFVIDELSTTQLVIPNEVVLNNAYPNPFNPVTNISFNLPQAMHVDINILDVQGRIVDTVASDGFNEGLNQITIDGNNLSSGLYFVQLIAGADIKYTKILLLK